MEHRPESEKANRKLSSYIKERVEDFDLEKFKNKDEECVILSVTKNGIYVGETYSANEIDNLNQKYKKVYPGDFTYNPHRINVGSIGIVPKLHKNMYVSKIYPVFYLTNNELPSYYLLKQLKNEEYRGIINDYCLGGARADLKLEWLKKIFISIPSYDEKESIQKRANDLEKAFNKYIKKLNALMKDD